MINKILKKLTAITIICFLIITGVVSVSADEITQKSNVSVIGNVNLDSIINITDATEIQLYLAQYVEFTDEQKAVADVNADKEVSILDATSIQMHLAKLEQETAIGETVCYHEAEYDIIHHEAVVETVKVIDREASYQEIPVCNYKYRTLCNDCGLDLTDWSNYDIMVHAGDHLLDGGKGSWRSGSYWVDLSTNTWVYADKTEEIWNIFNEDDRKVLSDATPDFDGYVFAHRKTIYCTQCDETGAYTGGDLRGNGYFKLGTSSLKDYGYDGQVEASAECKVIAQNHNEMHKSRGEECKTMEFGETVMVYVKSVSELSHYETVTIQEAYDEKVLIKEAGWY